MGTRKDHLRRVERVLRARIGRRSRRARALLSLLIGKITRLDASPLERGIVALALLGAGLAVVLPPGWLALPVAMAVLSVIATAGLLLRQRDEGL